MRDSKCFFSLIVRGCPLSMKHDSCSKWHPGATLEGVCLRIAGA
jgi:hypothetical protein